MRPENFAPAAERVEHLVAGEPVEGFVAVVLVAHVGECEVA
ncbi:hypothetical protein [Asanoa siamensis]|nr:hypothetical protein [Asanoa siamensis]